MYSAVSRLGNCEVCAKIAARYACPKCEVKTCSLPCVQIHKRELNCDGIRDRTKFMPISEMTEREFMSDYCFLEECTRFAENRKQDRSKRYTHRDRQLPVPQMRMRSEATKRGTRLQFLLPNFSRHKENKTYLNWKTQRFYWQIEWLFTCTGSTTTRFIDTKCDEQRTLADLLEKYLDLQHHETAREQRKLLQHHQSAGIGQLTLWLRAEGVRCSGSRCYRLEAHKTLRDNLVGKTIVEYPAIYVSYEQRPPAGHEVIDSGKLWLLFQFQNELLQVILNIVVDEEAEQKLAIKQEPPPSEDAPAEQKEEAEQPKPKKPKLTEKLPEINDIYELAASFGAGVHDDEDDDDSSEESSEEPLPGTGMGIGMGTEFY